jgi:cobalt-zinc-cadmium efflux system membrane fusion protein
VKRLAILACVILLAACSKGKSDPTNPAASEHSDEPAHEDLPKKVTLPANVIADAKIRTSPVTKEILATTLGLAGEIAADPDKSARISSPVAGHLEEVRFKEGLKVKKGDALALLRVPDLGKLRGAYAATAARARTARTNADRMKSLLDQRLTSDQAYLDAKAEADALDAEARAQGEQLNAMGAGAGGGSAFLLTLRSPIDGTVIARDAVVGQPITTERVLASIADLREVWFLGRVFEKDLGKLEEGSDAEVTLNAYPTEHFQGKLVRLGQQIDPVARTLTARIVLTNRKDLLRVGLFGVARVGLGQGDNKETVLVVPRTAVTEIAGKTVVFVRQPDGDFERHDVTLGAGALGKVQIVTGLREGEQVVVEGVFTLKSAVLKSSFAPDEE